MSSVIHLLTAQEVANILKLSKSQVYTLCREGAIPSIYIGRNLRIPSQEFYKWLKNQLPKEIVEETKN